VDQKVRTVVYSATACNATHGIAKAFLSVCPFVCLTVRPSVKRVHCDKTKETYSYTTRKKVYPSFSTRRMVGDDPLYLKFLAKLIPFWQKRRFSIDIRSYTTPQP